MKFSSLSLSAACSALAIAVVGSSGAFAGGTGAEVPKHIEKEITGALEETTSVLPGTAPDDRRVYITDPADFMTHTRIISIDGNKSKILGQVDAGIVPNPIVASNGQFYGHLSTVWSRVARGKRNDYLQILDPTNNEVVTDIDLPPARFLVNTYPTMAGLTPDDKSLLFYQFSPSPGVALIDLEAKKFVKIMDVPDCYHVFPTAADTFYMQCREGHLLKATFDKEGNLKHEKTKVFHPEDEFLINTAAYSPKAKRIVWSAYDGTIYQADLSSAEAKFLPTFEAFTDEEKKDRWAPGGWQPVAYHRESNRIFVLADQRAKWTHKYPSRFVFVYDAATGKRLSKFELGHEINSIGLSPDKEPLLYALSSGDRTLYIFDSATGKEKSKVGGLGLVPLIVTTKD